MNGTNRWTEPEDDAPPPANVWFYIAMAFWIIGIAAALGSQWLLAATGLITGTVAGVRSR